MKDSSDLLAVNLGEVSMNFEPIVPRGTIPAQKGPSNRGPPSGHPAAVVRQGVYARTYIFATGPISKGTIPYTNP
jgi:hypothetical protein